MKRQIAKGSGSAVFPKNCSIINSKTIKELKAIGRLIAKLKIGQTSRAIFKVGDRVKEKGLSEGHIITKVSTIFHYNTKSLNNGKVFEFHEGELEK